MSPGDEGLVVAQPVLTRASPVINTAKVKYNFDFGRDKELRGEGSDLTLLRKQGA